MKMVDSVSNIASLSLVLILWFTFTSPSLSTSNDMSYQSICNSTPYPSHCMSNMPRNLSATSVQDYCRFFIQRSLTSTNQLLSLVNSLLGRRLIGSVLPGRTARALEDCRFLTGLNRDTLSETYQTLVARPSIGSVETEDLETLLSAVLTNQQTCMDGLDEAMSASSVMSNVFAPMSSGTRLSSISLALFKQAWRKSSDLHDRGLTRGRRGRKLLQTVGGTDLGGVPVSRRVVVSQDGSGDFDTITDAVNSAPNKSASSSDAYFVIHVVRGVYEEYVMIPKNKQNLMMIGDGINQTVITGNRNVVDGWTTFNSATFAVVGQGFVGINITIRNTAGASKHQAVALRNGADLSAFYSCSFEGFQDTLYAHSMRQFYRDCDIYGTVDFIFGNAAAVLQNCNIYPRLAMANQFNAITAQGRTDPNQNTGTSVHNCSITPSDDLAAAGNGGTKTYLGRPWKEYSRTVFMQSFLGGLVDGSGWREWSGDFALDTLYYAEFGNTGPGSGTGARVTWSGYRPVISESDAMNFTVNNFIFGDSWLDSVSGVVPFTTGLL